MMLNSLSRMFGTFASSQTQEPSLGTGGPTTPTTGPYNPVPTSDGIEFPTARPIALAKEGMVVRVPCEKGSHPEVEPTGPRSVRVTCVPDKEPPKTEEPKTEQPKAPPKAPILE